MAFAIEIALSALNELKSIKRFHRQPIMDAIDAQLAHEPLVETRNRKQLQGLEPDFQHVPPIWELRVGSYRVFYDVDEVQQRIVVRAVREKPPHISTEEIV